MKRIICIVILLFILGQSVLKIDSRAVQFDLSAKASVLIEAQTGTVLYAENEHMKLPMASTTKILATLVTLESGELDEEFAVDDRALLTEGSSMNLCYGDIVSKRELCYGMMLPSGNDAANAAALKIGGEYEAFAEIMNRRACEIGMRNSSFVTPSGLHDDNHYSTAYDMALLARAAMKNDEFRKICSTAYIRLSDEKWSNDKYLKNSNKLLSRYDCCIGIKTGFTDEAGRCLVSAAERNGVMLIAVTLNAPDDWNDHIKMMEYGFSVTSMKKIDSSDESFVLSVAGGDTNEVKGVLAELPEIAEVNGFVPKITTKIILPEFVYAPVLKGDVLGKAEYYLNEELVCSVDIVADESCCAVEKNIEKSLYRFIIEKLKELF